MKTRTKATTRGVPEEESSKEPKFQLGPDSSNPPHLFILPEDLEEEARIVSLANPRYSSETRYVVSPKNGIYEFTKVATPKTTPRSWLLSPSENHSSNGTKSEGYITKSADLFIATPIDYLFFVLPALAPLVKSTQNSKRLFLSSDDYFEKLKDASPQFSRFLSQEIFRAGLESRMAVVCETVDAGEETMYRLSVEKLLQELIGKARRMVKNGLPASMEDKFIRQPLEAPMLSIKREESLMHDLSNEEETISESADTPDTQTTTSTTDSAATSFSEASTAASSFSTESPLHILKSESTLPPTKAPDGVAELLRLRTAILFICSNYLSPHLSTLLRRTLSSPNSPVDFVPLDTHLSHLTKLRQEAQAARSVGDYSRKKSYGGR